MSRTDAHTPDYIRIARGEISCERRPRSQSSRQVLTSDGDVPGVITHDPFRLHLESGFIDDDEPESVFRNEPALARVVDSPLLAAADPGDRLTAVEEVVRLRVLLLLELDDEPQSLPVSVNREREAASPVGRRVPTQPIEPGLTVPGGPEYLVAQIEDVVLVGMRSAGHESELSDRRATDGHGTHTDQSASRTTASDELR